MIAYIKGILVTKTLEGIVVENHGIGYNISIPLSDLDILPEVGKEVTIYTYTHVKEDAFMLFGFTQQEALKMFRMMIQVNGIGPKGALGILSALSVSEIQMAILSDNAKAIAKAPGVGAKTAGRMILELKDKIQVSEMLDGDLAIETPDEVKSNKATGAVAETKLALKELGYSQTEIEKALKSVDVQEGDTVEQILRKTLRNL